MKKSLLAFGLLMCAAFKANANLTSYIGTGGVGLVYSSVSNITWTQDANLLGTMETSNPNLVSTIISTIGSINDTPNEFDTPKNSGYHTLSTTDFNLNGKVSWFGAQAFVAYLNTINYAGSQQWTLPTAGAFPLVGWNETGTQFTQLFYNELGGNENINIPNTSNFTNEQNDAYWLSTEGGWRDDMSSPNMGWSFSTETGYQFNDNKNIQFHAWAIHPGKVAAVPLPAAIWLMGSTLLGMITLKRRW